MSRSCCRALYNKFILWRNFELDVNKQCSETRWTTLYIDDEKLNGISVSKSRYLVLGVHVGAQVEHPRHDADLVLHGRVHHRRVPRHVVAHLRQRRAVAPGLRRRPPQPIHARHVLSPTMNGGARARERGADEKHTLNGHTNGHKKRGGSGRWRWLSALKV